MIKTYRDDWGIPRLRVSDAPSEWSCATAPRRPHRNAAEEVAGLGGPGHGGHPHGLDVPGIARGVMDEVAGAEPVRWGELHRLAPCQGLPADEDEHWPGLGGDHDCVLATSSTPGVTDLSARGPSARYVWDLSRRENSLWIVPLGARGIRGRLTEEGSSGWGGGDQEEQAS